MIAVGMRLWSQAIWPELLGRDAVRARAIPMSGASSSTQPVPMEGSRPAPKPRPSITGTCADGDVTDLEPELEQPAEMLEVVVQPFKGFVFVDERGGKYFLTHMETHERVNLPAESTWELVEDDDSEGVSLLACTGGVYEVKPVSCYLTQHIAVHSASSVKFLVTHVGEDGSVKDFRSMDEILSAQRLCVMTATPGLQSQVFAFAFAFDFASAFAAAFALVVVIVFASASAVTSLSAFAFLLISTFAFPLTYDFAFAFTFAVVSSLGLHLRLPFQFKSSLNSVTR